MILKPLPYCVARPLGIAAIVLTFPVWGPFCAAIWLQIAVEDLVKPMLARPDGWRFAWLPVKCESWPDDGFNGVVWLETVWWSANPVGFSHWRREQPQRPSLATQEV